MNYPFIYLHVQSLISFCFPYILFLFRTKAKCDGKNGPELQQICGRPFGLGFYYRTGDLYITDAFYGLVVVGPSGGLVTRVPGFQGRNFAFLDALDIDQSKGVVYFLDSGAIFLTGLVAQKCILCPIQFS